MSSQIPKQAFFEKLAAMVKAPGGEEARAVSTLKAKIYSALVRRQTASGPLLSLTETKAGGRGLCFFEDSVRALPLGKKTKSLNLCSVCHARILAERFEKPPIYWPNCPYVGFKKS